MTMHYSAWSWRAAAAFTAQWGVMMAAMMLPSAAPMILLYHTVRRRLVGQDRAIPALLFAGIYLLVWLLTGIPVYLGYVAVAGAATRAPLFAQLMPYLIAGCIMLAGLYQFSTLKSVCLRYCEAPLSFLMRRWRGGYRATINIALRHAAYCIGCCWGLMLILVVAGGMSLPWVLAIATVVAAEKLLPFGWWTARGVGIVLVAMAVAVSIKPELARPPATTSSHAPMQP